MSAANALTVLRLVLAFILFGLLAIVNQSPLQVPENTTLLLGWSIVVLFVLTLLTDLLDGYLARRWNTESWFGRMADPLVDKVLICGMLVMLLGFPRERVQDVLRAWMVVLVVSRELLIQGVRSAMEKHGVDFPAMIWGKLKMALQSLTIFLLLLYGLLPNETALFDMATIILVWFMVIVTLLSAVMYFWQASRKVDQLDMDTGQA
jgi:CDP-diacylglycerol--glycerol-3-phosphate 3-phosphatidyltransferase